MSIKPKKYLKSTEVDFALCPQRKLNFGGFMNKPPKNDCSTLTHAVTKAQKKTIQKTCKYTMMEIFGVKD